MVECVGAGRAQRNHPPRSPYLPQEIEDEAVDSTRPLDVDAVVQAARQTGALVTAEEHSIVGGLGAAVAEAVTDAYPVPVKRVGLPDQFAETGPYAAILDRYGMSVNHIVTAARAAVSAKN